jgi:hypothetical protein
MKRRRTLHLVSLIAVVSTIGTVPPPCRGAAATAPAGPRDAAKYWLDLAAAEAADITTDSKYDTLLPICLVAAGQARAGDKPGLAKTVEVMKAIAEKEKESEERAATYRIAAASALITVGEKDQAIALLKEVERSFPEPPVNLVTWNSSWASAQLARQLVRLGDHKAAQVHIAERDGVEQMTFWEDVARAAVARGDKAAVDRALQSGREVIKACSGVRADGNEVAIIHFVYLLCLGRSHDEAMTAALVMRKNRNVRNSLVVKVVADAHKQLGKEASAKLAEMVWRDIDQGAAKQRVSDYLDFALCLAGRSPDGPDAVRSLERIRPDLPSLSPADQYTFHITLAVAQGLSGDVAAARKTFATAKAAFVDVRGVNPLEELAWTFPAAGLATEAIDLINLNRRDEMSRSRFIVGLTEAGRADLAFKFYTEWKVQRPPYLIQAVAKSWAKAGNRAGLETWAKGLKEPRERAAAYLGGAEAILGHDIEVESFREGHPLPSF